MTSAAVYCTYCQPQLTMRVVSNARPDFLDACTCTATGAEEANLTGNVSDKEIVDEEIACSVVLSGEVGVHVCSASAWQSAVAAADL